MEQLILVAARALERLAIVGTSALSLWCGYRLFAIVAQAESSAVFQGKGFKITLQRVGPGIFFALFGSLVLGLALWRGLDVQQLPPPGGVTHVYYENGGGDSSQSAIQAVNGIQGLVAQLQNEQRVPNTEETRRLEAAAPGLEMARELIVDARFGQGSFVKYKMVKRECDSRPPDCERLISSLAGTVPFQQVDDFNSLVAAN